jgi:hypothetical protein
MKQYLMETAAMIALIFVYTVIIGFLFVNGMHPGVIVLLTLFGVTILVVVCAKTYSGTRKRAMLLTAGIIQVISGFAVTGMIPSDVPDPVRTALLSSFIGIGVIFVIRGIFTNRDGNDRRILDERTLRIGTYGLSYSWYLTYLTVVIIGLLAATEMIAFSGVQICFILILVMPVSARIFQWYFNSRGDVY